jgi:hypothetical protein
MLFGFGLFARAGATGHVFLVKNGKRNDKGLAYSGIVGPGTTIAVVPTTQQVLNFNVDAQTKDKQTVSVVGNVKVTLSPAAAVATFDFTVDPQAGSYRARWETNLQALVMERVLGPIREKVKLYKLDEVVTAHAAIEEAIVAEIGTGEAALEQKGVTIDSCSVPDIAPEDENLSEALGASEREAMLTEADAATHERQMKASKNARAVKTYDSETAFKLEQDRAKIVQEQGKNKLEEAKVDAEATKARLEPFNDVDSSKVFATAIFEAAKSGRIGTMNLTSDLYAAIAGAK